MEKKQRGHPRKIPEQVVDWEALAKNLQLALERERMDREREHFRKLHRDTVRMMMTIRGARDAQ